MEERAPGLRLLSPPHTVGLSWADPRDGTGGPSSVTGHASRKEAIYLGVSAILPHRVWTAVLGCLLLCGLLEGCGYFWPLCLGQ